MRASTPHLPAPANNTCSPVSSLCRIAIGIATLALPVWLAWVPSAQADELPTFAIVIRDSRFVPDHLEVPANTKFRLTVKNEGVGAEEFESPDLKKEKIVAAGASAVLVFSPLKPATYHFYGEFHPDTAQGVIVVN